MVVPVVISSDSEFSNKGAQNNENAPSTKNKQLNMNFKQKMIKKFKDDQMGD